MNGPRGGTLTALLLALAGVSACSGDPDTTSFGGATETGPVPPATDTSTTGTPTTGAVTEASTTTGDTTQSVVTGTTTGDSTTTGTGTEASTTGTTGTTCLEDQLVCEDGSAKICDGMGGYKSEEACPDACVPDVGCKPCAPKSFQCVGEISQKCSADYTWEDFETCDPVQGLSCDPEGGKCDGACALGKLGESYIGCDYYPATLANLHETQPWVFSYAVVVANTTEEMASVTITRGDNPIKTLDVGPGTASVVELGYIDDLVKPTIANNGPTVLVADGSYRLRSTQPVTVYQYEPLEYQAQGLFSYTNDASLLLPVHIWTGNYIVASRNHWVFGLNHLPGFYAVIASQDETTVTLTPSATGGSVYSGAGIKPDGTGKVVLNAGDVLEVFTKTTGLIPDADLTGTVITADKPVSVFGGHKCVQVPLGTQACDRLEEAMLPVETLSKKYIVTPPLIPTGGNVPKAQMVRIIATEAETALTYDPPQNGAPALLTNVGDWVEVGPVAADFEISADKKILVSQYMQGQQAGGNSGDPAMALAVATEQFRSTYLVHAPLSYEVNFANIVAPMDAMITLDGAAVGGFVPIGKTGFGVARVQITSNLDGNHSLAGDKPFGVSVYGYGQYTSYWYPGGLDLKLIPG